MALKQVLERSCLVLTGLCAWSYHTVPTGKVSWDAYIVFESGSTYLELLIFPVSLSRTFLQITDFSSLQLQVTFQFCRSWVSRVHSMARSARQLFCCLRGWFLHSLEHQMSTIWPWAVWIVPSRMTLSNCFCSWAFLSLTLRRTACWNELKMRWDELDLILEIGKRTFLDEFGTARKISRWRADSCGFGFEWTFIHTDCRFRGSKEGSVQIKRTRCD